MEAAERSLSVRPFIIRSKYVLAPRFLSLTPVSSFPLILSIGPTLLIFIAGINADIQTATAEKISTKNILSGFTIK